MAHDGLRIDSSRGQAMLRRMVDTEDLDGHDDEADDDEGAELKVAVRRRVD